MKSQRLTVWMVMALLACAAASATAQNVEKPRGKPKAPELTAEEKAFLDRVKELRKEIRIARLELALLEAKDAAEKQIAAKAEDVYRVQGQLYALRAKNRELARGLVRQRMQHAWHQAPGSGRGWGMGQHWQGPGMGWQRGHRMGLGMGCGRGMGMRMGERVWEEMGPPPGPPGTEVPPEKQVEH